ncbi:MAG: methionine--tRNA ligase [Patescibacteria group bacterium]|jgi:methionyl-tRNA synthetase
MNKKKNKIFIGLAWPYANGSLHLGHLAGLLGGDIVARYHRLAGHDVLMVSGSDCHGTPIAVEADKQNVAPETIAEKYHAEFKDIFLNKLNFSFDCYTKTTTKNHEQVVQEFFLDLQKKGYIYSKFEDLAFCEKCQRFLPDRYVEGECPKCHFEGARGDQCDNCGSLLDANQLIKPRCKTCGSTPVWKPSEHFFLKLSAFQKQLEKWVAKSQGWRANAKNFTLNFLQEGLHDRAITRDTNWGIDIPLPGYEGKKIYVWFEAVIGYLSASCEWAQNRGDAKLWQDFWQNDSAQHYYFHGKDNIPFHAVIWPAMLLGHGDLHLPDYIISSEFLTIENKQFSKSRHWAVWLPDFLSKFEADTIRYYLVISGPETSDADFSWAEYQVKVNSELIGKFGNLVNRVFSFINKHCPDGLHESDIKLDKPAKDLLKLTEQAFGSVGENIAKAKFRDSIKIILNLAESANRYLEETSPWKQITTDRASAERSLFVASQVIYNLATLLNPFIPNSTDKILTMLGQERNQTAGWQYALLPTIKIAKVEPLFARIDDEVVEQEVQALGK